MSISPINILIWVSSHIGYLLAGGVLLMSAGLFMLARLFRVIRERHPALHASLGRPAVFAITGIRSDLAVARFIFGGGFRRLDDPPLAVLCRSIRTVFCVYALIFLSAAGIVIACLCMVSTGHGGELDIPKDFLN